MIHYREDEAKRFIEFKVSGKVTKENMDAFEQKIQPRMDKWQGIRLDEVIENLSGAEIRALIKDTAFGLKNWSNFNNKVEKCAVVADEKWIRFIADAIDPIFKPKIKTFYTTQIEEARDWVLH